MELEITSEATDRGVKEVPRTLSYTASDEVILALTIVTDLEETCVEAALYFSISPTQVVRATTSLGVGDREIDP